jgi:hypothetical protein
MGCIFLKYFHTLSICRPLCYRCCMHNIHDIPLNLRMDKARRHLYIHRCFIQYTFWTFSWSKYIFLFFMNGRNNNNKILKWSPHLSCFQTDVTIRTLHPTTGFVIYTSHVIRDCIIVKEEVFLERERAIRESRLTMWYG